jgi:hypothetical protein
MLIKKALLAAAAVISLAAPAVASAQDFSGYRDGYRQEQRADFGRHEQRRNFAWRQVEREREIRRDLWRARFEHHHAWRSDRGFHGEHRGSDEYRAY